VEPKVGVSELGWILGTAATTRHHNADFLREYFPNDKKLQEAANHLEKAAEKYEKALETLESGVLDQTRGEQIALLLVEAGSREKEAGISLPQKNRCKHQGVKAQNRYFGL